MVTKDDIVKALAKITGVEVAKIQLETPKNEEFGDYSSNVAMATLSKAQILNSKFQENLNSEILNHKSPHELAEEIVNKLKTDKELEEVVDRIEVASPGFINFWLKKDVLIDYLVRISREKESFGRVNSFKGKKFLLEHTSPNTIKTLHVGHVRNNVLGMAVHNILEFAGAQVTLDAINNDRGIHVMKAIWAYMKYGGGKSPRDLKEKPDHFVDKFYVMGTKESENPQVKKEMQDLLKKWESDNEEVRLVWKKLRDFTLEGFKETYKRLGSHHDHEWFESRFYRHGKEMVENGLKLRVFRKLKDGAVLSDLKKFGLSDAIVLRADGTSMYHTQDLYLTKLKREKFPSDLYIWDIGPEQELYLKQLFAMCEQLGIGRRQDFFHMSYGFVYLKGRGRMSSRAGTVISADWLMDQVVARTNRIIGDSGTNRGLSASEKKEVSEAVGLGAIKYGFLKLARNTDIHFDIDESLSLEGNSGPYLQYTVARINSVLAKIPNSKFQIPNNLVIDKLNNEEISLLRSFVHFSEIISMSAKNYSPNLLCNYLYDLAQKFNLFYQKHGILEDRSITNEDREIVKNFRLLVTSATGQILKNGLGLLGIQVPERM